MIRMRGRSRTTSAKVIPAPTYAPTTAVWTCRFSEKVRDNPLAD